MKAIRLKSKDLQIGEAHNATVERLRKYFDEATENGRECGHMSAHIYLYADSPKELRDLREAARNAIKVAFEKSYVIAWTLMHITPMEWDEKKPCYKTKIIIDFEKEPE